MEMIKARFIDKKGFESFRIIPAPAPPIYRVPVRPSFMGASRRFDPDYNPEHGESPEIADFWLTQLDNKTATYEEK